MGVPEGSEALVHVLVVADDGDVRRGLGRLFKAAGASDVMYSGTREPCAGAVRRPDVVLIDAWPHAAPRATELARTAAGAFAGVPVIVLAHHVTPEVETAIRGAGGRAVWPKDDASGLVGFARHLAEFRRHARDD